MSVIPSYIISSSIKCSPVTGVSSTTPWQPPPPEVSTSLFAARKHRKCSAKAFPATNRHCEHKALGPKADGGFRDGGGLHTLYQPSSIHTYPVHNLDHMDRILLDQGDREKQIYALLPSISNWLLNGNVPIMIIIDALFLYEGRNPNTVQRPSEQGQMRRSDTFFYTHFIKDQRLQII